jgi:Concanavalin A-like lectin/glucanases superfamily
MMRMGFSREITTILTCLAGLAAACGSLPETMPPDGTPDAGPDEPPPDAAPDAPPDAPLPAPATPGTLGAPFAFSALELKAGQAVRDDRAASVAVDRLTLEAWVRWDGDAGRQLVIYNGDVGRDGYGIAIEEGALRVVMGGVGDAVCATCVLPPGAWVHVAAVRDGGWSIYLNGARGALAGAQLAPRAPTAGFSLGAARSSSGERAAGLRGALDEVRVWEQARTAAQLAEQQRVAQFGDEAGLVAYYRLDEGRGSTVADSSPRRRVVALLADDSQQPPAWIVSDARLELGLARSSAEPGARGGMRAASIATAGTDELTLEAWVLWSGRTERETLLYNGDSSRSGYGLLLEGGRLRVLVGGVGYASCETCQLAFGVWTHVAVVRSRGSWLFYQAGELKRTVAGVVPSAPTGALWVGVSGTAGTEPFPGGLDELRIWTRERSVEELRAAARTSLRGDETGLGHYYRFDEAAGDRAADAAGALPLSTASAGDPRWRRSDVPLAQAAR